MILIRKINEALFESLDGGYRWRNKFETEPIEMVDEETDEVYYEDTLTPVQMAHFQTDEGVKYLWYARQNRYDDATWDIAFGVEMGQSERGEYKLDIEKTGTGNAARVFATVIEITNAFIEYAEHSALRLTMTSVGDNRTRLYLKRLLPLIDNFEISDQVVSGNETIIHLTRTN